MSSNGKNRKLVVVQLSGGNDYLNCIVPYNDPLYIDNRPNIRISEERALPLDENYGFNPGTGACQRFVGRGQSRNRTWHWVSHAEPLALPLDGHLAYRRADQGGRSGLARPGAARDGP